MKKLIALLSLVVLCGASGQTKIEPLPSPVSNNAVASLNVHRQLLIFSFMGIGPKKTWDAITNAAYAVDADEGKWTALHPVPGTAGRIAG